METVWILTDERYLGQRMPRALGSWLAAEQVPTRTLVADRLVATIGDPEAEDPWSALRQGDVVVARSRDPFALSLLRTAVRPGVTVLTTWESVAGVRNKARAAQTLAAAGVPTPKTLLAANPAALKSVPRRRFPLLLKPHLGDNARGIVLVRSPDELADIVWTDGMVLAQEHVDVGGIDLKLYAAGSRVWAVRRPSPLLGVDANGDVPPENVEPTPELAALARACARAFGLTLLGVDVLETAEGPLVVDVNDFPNYTGVPEAAETIGRLARRALGANGRTEAARSREATCVS